MNNKVIFNTQEVCTTTVHDISELKKRTIALGDSCRLCLHLTHSDSVQEMIIAHLKEAYIRPHKHEGCTTSYHMIEGELDVVVFTDLGKVDQIISLAVHDLNKSQIMRLCTTKWYMPIIRSSIAIFHEVITGPFVENSSTEWASWSPDGSDEKAKMAFLQQFSLLN